MFLGQYKLSMGDDHSLLIPEVFQGLLASGAYITRGFEQDLLVMSEAEFQAISARVASLNLANPAVRQLQRLILGNASHLDFDSNGRVIIPDELAEFAGLKKDAVLIGQGDYFEVWAPDVWKKQASLLLDYEANSSRFAQLDLSLS